MHSIRISSETKSALEAVMAKNEVKDYDLGIAEVLKLADYLLNKHEAGRTASELLNEMELPKEPTMEA